MRQNRPQHIYCCSYYWAGQHEPSSFSPQHRKHRSFSFFSSSLNSKLMDDWPPRSTSRLYLAYGGLWYFAERGKLLPWCRSDNMLDNGGWRDDAPISSPSSSIWISCAVKASDKTNYKRTRRLFTILVRVSRTRYSEVLEWRMKWSQRSSSLQTTRTDAHHDRRRPVERCGDLWFIGWGAPSVISCKRRPAE